MTIINKRIIYSDIVLPLKDIGKNIKVTSIPNVSESSLEQCLKIIFESNPDVIFNNIQYSKKNKKVYFYTNKVISTKKYEESKKVKYKPITSSSEILSELKNVLSTGKNRDNNYISLYEIINIIKQKNNQYEQIKNNYKLELAYTSRSKYNDLNIIIYDFDYKKSELVIGVKYFKHYDKIAFSKKEGDLFITESESFLANDILALSGNTLSELYDEFIKYKDFKEQYKYSLKSINSKFSIDISPHQISIYMKDLRLTAYSYKDEYQYSCNSNIVISAFQGKENEIFKKILIKIEDCPKYYRTILYKKKNNQLSKEQKIEDKQKKLELVKTIFPHFLKKYSPAAPHVDGRLA